MPLVAGHIQVAHRTDAQNLVPAVIFLKDLQHLFLFHHLFQFGRVGTVGNPKQQSVVVFHDVEQADVSGAGNQAAVVTVHGITQTVVVRVELSVGVEQAGFVFHAPFFKQADHFVGVTFRTYVGNVGRNDFLHLLLDALHVVQSDGAVDVELAEIAFRNGVLQGNTSLRIKFFHCFDQDEKQRTDVGPHARWTGDVQKFHVFVVVHPEVETFNLVIDFGTDRTVRHGQIKTVINIQK